VTDILRVEGCAQCLVAHTYDQDECAKVEDANKSPEAAATSRAANDAFILLGCKLLHCKHVVHVLCVLKLQAKLRAAAAAGSAVVNKMILPTLDLCHSTSFFRVIAFPIGTQSVTHKQSQAAATNIRRRFCSRILFLVFFLFLLCSFSRISFLGSDGAHRVVKTPKFGCGRFSLSALQIFYFFQLFTFYFFSFRPLFVHFEFALLPQGSFAFMCVCFYPCC
jgi:hypothetical protein